MLWIYKLFKKLSFSSEKVGSITIVGVGPGDPSLLTIAAVKALRNSKIIFCPISGEDKSSISAEIVKKYIKNKKQIPLFFPMAKKYFDAEEVWKSSAEKIVKYIKKNISVTLLTLGDTSIYSSCFFISDEITKNYPEIKINVIPGISSFSLAAALSNFQLIKNGESLQVLECPDDANLFLKLIAQQNKKVFVIMKVGKRWKWVRNVLQEIKIIEKTFLATNLGMTNQFIGQASNYLPDELPYFSLLLLRL